jgi:hypothetical protein
MSVINPGNTLEFKSSESIFARIRKRLKSYDNVGVLDEGDWYYYIKEVLDKLGASVYNECEAVLTIDNFKACLPEDFSYLYAAYKCTSNGIEGTLPQTGFVFYIDETHEAYKKGTGWNSTKEIIGDKITIRTYIEGVESSISYSNPCLLRLSGNNSRVCDSDCQNIFAKSIDEITINNSRVYTNFNDGCILMKYYALPLDKESGLPLIPDNPRIEKAIEDYIVYRIFEDFYFNGDVPDIQNKYQLARANNDDSIKEALYWCKFPTFQNAINKIRVDRKRFSIYQ